jgi:multidrug efflux pump subunit AcrB
VWLPEDAPLSATNEAARHAEEVVREVAEEYGKEHAEKDGKPREVLKSLTTFVGGGGPRFWFSVSPELQQLNYAQVIIEVNDKHDTNHLIGPIQKALDERIPGARVDVRQLDTGKPITMPVEIRISGSDMDALHQEAEKVKNILRATPYAQRVRDDWGEENFTVKLQTDSDRANVAGITNLDVATSSATGINGSQVTVLREGDKQIPIVARLRMEERAQLADMQNLYVYSMQGSQKVPLRQVSSIEYGMQTEKVRRRNQFRTITVSCMAEPGHLPSEIVSAARPQLTAFAAQLPSGYRMDFGGSEEEQVKGFKNQTVVLIISLVAIYLSLVYQFKNAIKPFVVFAAVPYGIAGAGGAVDHGHAVRIYGLPGDHQSGWVDRQSHHRALRLHRREARGRRAAEGGSAGCRHHATAPGDDHSAGPGVCTGPAGDARRAAVGADVLRANGRDDGCYVHHVAACAGDLFDLRSRSQTD